jgi:hypothetical protein
LRYERTRERGKSGRRGRTRKKFMNNLGSLYHVFKYDDRGRQYDLSTAILAKSNIQNKRV